MINVFFTCKVILRVFLCIMCFKKTQIYITFFFCDVMISVEVYLFLNKMKEKNKTLWFWTRYFQFITNSRYRNCTKFEGTSLVLFLFLCIVFSNFLFWCLPWIKYTLTLSFYQFAIGTRKNCAGYYISHLIPLVKPQKKIIF